MQGSSRDDRELLDAAALCAHLVPEGSVHAFLAEHRLRLFPDEMFVDLFPTNRGRPSVAADVVATVMVLQALEGLSDREAVRQLETNIAWKAATGLALTDEAFHSTVLVLWRNKLRTSDAPQRIFDAVRTVITESGVLAGKTRRALDSTVLDDAVARQDTITMLVTQIRRVRKLIAELAVVWVREHNLEPGRALCDWEDPADRDRLVSELVDDANELVWAAEDLVADGTVVLTDKQADAIALLALVAGQDVEPGDGPGQWRIARRTAPDRIISTVDPESRHVHKTRTHHQDGFKAHLAIEPETGLFTAVALRPGCGPAHHEAAVAADLLADEQAPVQLFADTAYDSGDARHRLHQAGHRLVIKPAPLRPAIPGGFTLDDFAIDTTAATVTCPAGHTVALSPPGGQHHQRKAFFGDRCVCCPLRERCTTAKAGRLLTIRPHHDLMAAARRQAVTDEVWQADYRRWRPPVERAVAWVVARGNRRLRYLGTIKNDAWLHTRAAALNLRTLISLGLTRTNGTWVISPSIA